MTVLDRSELQASPLSDLHLIADQIGLEGFRRLRKADLIDAILGEKKDDAGEAKDAAEEEPARRPPARRSRGTRSRRSASKAGSTDEDSSEDEESSGSASEESP